MNDPPEGQDFYFSSFMDVPSTIPGNIFAGRSGRLESVGGEEEPDRMEEEVGVGTFDIYSGPK